MKRVYVIAFIFCATILIWQIFSNRNEDSLLKERGKITTGTILAFKDVNRFKQGVSYLFLVDKRSYKQEDERTELNYKYFDMFLGRTFPVIYDPENPEVSHIILTKSDFKQFHIPIPDTLRRFVDKTE